MLNPLYKAIIFISIIIILNNCNSNYLKDKTYDYKYQGNIVNFKNKLVFIPDNYVNYTVFEGQHNEIEVTYNYNDESTFYLTYSSYFSSINSLNIESNKCIIENIGENKTLYFGIDSLGKYWKELSIRKDDLELISIGYNSVNSKNKSYFDDLLDKVN